MGSFPTHEEALAGPPSGIELPDWVQLCDKFASEKFQKLSKQNKKNRSLSLIHSLSSQNQLQEELILRQGTNVTTIDNYEIAHYCEKKKKMGSEEADAVLNNLRSEESVGSGTPTEICFKVLKHVPGHLRGRSAPKKEILAVENLRTIVELERNKSATLEEKLKEVVVEQDEMKKCMGLMMKEIQRLSKLVPDKSVKQEGIDNIMDVQKQLLKDSDYRSENDDKVAKLFALNEVSQKKHIKLSAMDVLYESAKVKPFHLKPSVESRFDL
uniref:Protein kinase-like domain, phloem protein 2-like protein n=1 Tax=Tanacetum cinerariifolium TaxID=118510 RepID=A0A6L2LRW7_TANCI|nr:protein kinase-like domain, phloem protein 2-like protein [Tanacetum cinerariifolium]